MIGLLIINLLVSVMIVVTVIIVGATIERHVDESLCDLMTAVFNADAIKAQAEEASKNGKGYIEL